ncbi:hypothetical protein CVT26_005590 [Gymnopilus dilepis]|uniref:Uncharacterized protein n=1 Tax=Gymnopilus dilepis TaxID=231916 RepID=A0A409XZX5_9AGAR|nr:hypothetical protein CVT26_005590 [Gymnopilus dilepis]
MSVAAETMRKMREGRERDEDEGERWGGLTAEIASDADCINASQILVFMDITSSSSQSLRIKECLRRHRQNA